MLACRLDVPAPEVVRRALLEQRLVLNATGADTVRMLPPLTIGPEHVEDAAARLGAVLRGGLGQAGR
jgi:acetylornithine aminotransferase/acetylornithine/N-succinyldiaminopimelate aminotransferase